MIFKLSIFLFILSLDDVFAFPNPSAGRKLSRRKKLINGIKTLFMSDIALADMAKKMYEKHYFKAAVSYYSKAIKQKSNIAEYYIRRGECQMVLQNKDEVIADYKAAALCAADPKPHQIRLCQTLFEFERFDLVRTELRLLEHEELSRMATEMKTHSKIQEAIIIYDEAIEKYPHERYYRSRGLCYRDLGNRDAALSDFREAAACRDRYADNYTRILLIDTLLDAKNFDDAKDEMSSLTHSQLSNEGDRYLSQKKFEEAACFYGEAIIKFPHEKYYRSRGICCKEMRNLKDAIFNFREAVSRPPEYSDFLTRTHLVEALLAAHKFDDATEEMNDLKDDELADLGDKYRSRNQFKEAICLYTAIIVRNPHEKFYRSRGICYKESGDLKAAISDFREAVSRPVGYKDNSTRLHLIEALLANKSFNDAMKEMTDLNDSELVDRGNLLSAQSKFEDAIYFYSAAIEKQPSSAEPYRFRANCYTKKGDLKNAILDFENVIARDQNELLKCTNTEDTIGDDSDKLKTGKNKRSRVLLCAALFEFGKFTDAENEIKNLEVPQLLDLGDELFERHLFDMSFKCYEEAVKIEPENPTCYERRAQYYDRRGSLQKALQDYDTVVKIAPSCVSCWINLVELLLKVNNYIRAEEIFQSQSQLFVKLKPDLSDKMKRAQIKINIMKGAEARRRREEEEARRRRREQVLRNEEIRRRRRRDSNYGTLGGVAFMATAGLGSGGACGKREPNNSRCHEKRAQFYHKRGSLPMASFDYQTALGLDPSNASVWFELIESLIQLNDHVRARAVFQNHSQVFSKTRPEYTGRIQITEQRIRGMEEADARRKWEEAEARRRWEAEETRRREAEARRRRDNDNSFLYGALGGMALMSVASAGCGGGGCGGGCGGGGCGG